MLRPLSYLGGARPLCGPPAPLLLLVRGRKTRYDPPAKSKVGRVATPPAVDPAEFYVLAERYRQYRQIMRALRCVWRTGDGEAAAGVSGGWAEGADLGASLAGCSSCPRCGGRYTRRGPGCWRSARRWRTPLSTAS